MSALEIVDARVTFRDNDSIDTPEILISRPTEYGHYAKRPMSGGHSYSDEQAQIIGAPTPRESRPGWHVYLREDGPLVSFFTWGGGADDGFGGWRRTITLDDGTEEEIIGGWHSSSDVAERAGFDPVMSVSVFDDAASWERGHTAMAAFCKRDALLEAVAEFAPHLSAPDEGYEFGYNGQPNKTEFRYLERMRLAAEKLQWERENGRAWAFDEHYASGDYHDPKWAMRSYTTLGPAPSRSWDIGMSWKKRGS